MINRIIDISVRHKTLVLAAAATLLYFIPPVAGGIYPPCFFHWLTGLYCPGCGSTRCLHALLHGNFRQAAGGGAAHQVHLEHPVAGVQEAQRGGGVLVGLGTDAGDAVLVQGDVDRGGQEWDRGGLR